VGPTILSTASSTSPAAPTTVPANDPVGRVLHRLVRLTSRGEDLTIRFGFIVTVLSFGIACMSKMEGSDDDELPPWYGQSSGDTGADTDAGCDTGEDCNTGEDCDTIAGATRGKVAWTIGVQCALAVT
jgi:hypothetical protein